MEKSTGKIKITISVLCGTWFLLTSWIWVYWANLFISFPVGLLGIGLWQIERKADPNNKALKISLILHILGLALATISLFFLLINN